MPTDCIVCGNVITGHGHLRTDRKYCSPSCARASKKRPVFSRICRGCGMPFETTNTPKVFCKDTCRRKVATLMPSIGREYSLSTGTVGALSELRVAIDLMLRGFHVYRAQSPAAPVDLMIFKNGELPLKVEVKTGHERNGHLYIPPLKTNNHDILAIATPTEIHYMPELPQ